MDDVHSEEFLKYQGRCGNNCFERRCVFEDRRALSPRLVASNRKCDYHGHMIRTLRESKARLSELVELASRGQDVLISVRGNCWGLKNGENSVGV